MRSTTWGSARCNAWRSEDAVRSPGRTSFSRCLSNRCKDSHHRPRSVPYVAMHIKTCRPVGRTMEYERQEEHVGHGGERRSCFGLISALPPFSVMTSMTVRSAICRIARTLLPRNGIGIRPRSTEATRRRRSAAGSKLRCPMERRSSLGLISACGAGHCRPALRACSRAGSLPTMRPLPAASFTGRFEPADVR